MPPGTQHVITHYRDLNVNLRAQLERIIRRAGLEVWPKLFQNLRSTRETELTEEFPMHLLCKWIGNSQPVAAQHYLQLTDEHFDRAVSGTNGRFRIRQLGEGIVGHRLLIDHHGTRRQSDGEDRDRQRAQGRTHRGFLVHLSTILSPGSSCGVDHRENRRGPS